MKQIQKLGKAKFKVTTSQVVNSELNLDFAPIIEQLSERQKQQPYQLIHWQAKPKGHREWGVYDSVTDSYSCGVWQDSPVSYGGSRLVMLDDAEAATIPSAVIYHVGRLRLW